MQHQQSVKTDCDAGARRQSRAQRVYEFLVNLMDCRLILAPRLPVPFEAGQLFVCVCQFDESVCKLETTVKQLKSIGHHRIVGTNTCERSLPRAG